MVTPRDFDAFLSYSRKDAPFAGALHRALERFKPPAGLGKGTRRLRVFRDEGDLVGTAYFEAIDRHLARTGKLLVLCSPDARASTYVNDEIERYVRLHGASGLIPVLVRGRPNNEAGTAEAGDAAFPEALCTALGMPLAVDYVDFEPGADRVDRGRFGNAWYTLLANLYDCSRQDIEQRDLRRQRRQRVLAVSTASTVIVVLSGLTAFAFHQRGVARDNEAAAQIQRQRAEDNERRSRALLFAARAREARGNGDLAAALGWAAAAHELMPDVAAVQTAVMSIFYDYRQQLAAPSEMLHALDERPFSTAFSDDARWLATGGHASAEVLDLGGRARKAFRQRRVWAIDIAPDGRLALGTERDGTYLLDPASGQQGRQINEHGVSALAFDGQGRFLVTARWDSQGAALHDLSTGRTHDLAFAAGSGRLATVGFSPDGRWAWVNRQNGEAWRWAVATGDVEQVLPGRQVREVAFDGQGRMLAATADGLWWWPGDGPPRHQLVGRPVRHVATTVDGRTVALSTDDGEAGAWDVDTETWRTVFKPAIQGEDYFRRLILAPDGRHALTTHGSFNDLRGELWQLSAPARRAMALDLTLLTKAIHFSADSRALLLVGDKGVHRVAVGGARLEAVTEAVSVQAPASRLTTHDGYTVDATNTTSAAVRAPGQTSEVRLDAKCYVTAPPLLSEQRDRVVLGTKCADARVFALADPEGLPVIFRPASREMIGAMAMSADGRYLAVAGGIDPGDQPFEVTVFAMDAPERELFSVVSSAPVLAMGFTADGGELLVDSADQRRTRWPLAPRIGAWVLQQPEFAQALAAARASAR